MVPAQLQADSWFEGPGGAEGAECYNFEASKLRGASPAPIAAVGEWLSLVEHLVRDQGVGGSNPLSPTNLFKHLNATSGFPSTAMVSKL